MSEPAQVVVTETQTLYVDEHGNPVQPVEEVEAMDELPLTQAIPDDASPGGASDIQAASIKQQKVAENSITQELSQGNEQGKTETTSAQAPEPATGMEPPLDIHKTERGPDHTTNDPALASLQRQYGKLTLVRFQDEAGNVLSTEVQDSMGKVLSKKVDKAVEEIENSEFLESLERKHGPLTVSRFVDVGFFGWCWRKSLAGADQHPFNPQKEGIPISTEIYAGQELVFRGLPGEDTLSPPKPMEPIDRGAMFSLVVLGIITLLFVMQLGWGVFVRESEKERRSRLVKNAVAKKTKLEEQQTMAGQGAVGGPESPKGLGKAA